MNKQELDALYPSALLYLIESGDPRHLFTEAGYKNGEIGNFMVRWLGDAYEDAHCSVALRAKGMIPQVVFVPMLPADGHAAYSCEVRDERDPDNRIVWVCVKQWYKTIPGNMSKPIGWVFNRVPYERYAWFKIHHDQFLFSDERKAFNVAAHAASAMLQEPNNRDMGEFYQTNLILG